ncbi:MAG: ribonuclease III [Cytophagales bacterium]|nr:ribonuclease III [Bernardetiaceae bacterium]MDW8211264.1 ribonuclease III [Cytophagales bacterium]
MRSLLRHISNWFRAYSPEEKKLLTAIRQITGKKPSNLQIYQLALIHCSVAREMRDGYRESNERLEYLGDAILGAVVAEYLFKKYPYKDEGFLTEIRSRIVSRDSLNALARKIGLDKLVIYDAKRSKSSPQSFKYIYGDAMEAFVGAVFLDKGFRFCRRFIVEKLLDHHFDMDEIVETDTNYKSRLIEWAQRNNRTVRFELLSERQQGAYKQFKVQVLVNNQEIARGSGYSKKQAEQDAARKACEYFAI